MTDIQPVVHIKNNTVFANSKDVADYFGKRHDNVVRDINKICLSLLKFEDTPDPWFQTALHKCEQNGETYGSFDMTKEGFTLLVMGFVGEKALQFKLKYIQRFNEMEAQLKHQANTTSVPDFSDPAAAARACNTKSPYYEGEKYMSRPFISEHRV